MELAPTHFYIGTGKHVLKSQKLYDLKWDTLYLCLISSYESRNKNGSYFKELFLKLVDLINVL